MKQKNHPFITDVFKELHSLNPSSSLILIGTGPLEKEIRNMVERIGLKNSVEFIGSVPNVQDYLQAMDVYLFPSLFEGLSLSIIEAQAAGLLCFASDKIDKKSKITDLVEFLSLDLSPFNWADKILKKAYGNERKDMYSEISNAGYNVKNTSLWLESFYKSLTPASTIRN